MSIVPYDHTQEIVFHDPKNRILVLHDNQDNSIQLLTSTQAENEYPLTLYKPVDRNGSYSNMCPHCGSLLGEFQNPPGNARRNSADILRDESLVMNPHDVVPAGFMHDDYFKMLSKLSYGHVLGDTGSSDLPEDIFNQGYFDRFFQKIPPYVLGSGAHAQVYKVMHVLKDVQLGVYAVKRINVGDHLVYVDQVLNEVLILYELSVKGANENNLIRYNHVWMELGDLKDLETFYLSDKEGYRQKSGKVPYVFILQQYCGGGHLENLIIKNFQREQHMTAKEKVEAERQRRRRRHSAEQVTPTTTTKKWLNEFEIWKYFRDIAKGVHYLHSHGILHRDLKPSNCLLELSYDPDACIQTVFASLPELDEYAAAMPKVLVSDFGEGKFIDKQFLADQSIRIEDDLSELRGNTGTIEFTDPRLWTYAKSSLKARRGQKLANSFSYNSDIYSLGMILCYLCTGAIPFTEKLRDPTDPEQIRKDISKWYQNLTPDSFHAWFSDRVSNTMSVSEAAEDFEILIYMALKGGEEPLEVTSRTILDYLDSMKWKHFLFKNRKVSEVTRDDVSLDEENVVDLQKELKPVKVPPPPSFVKPVAFNLAQILLSEYLHDYVKLSRSVKLINLLCLAMVALDIDPKIYWPSFYACVGVLLVCNVGYFAAKLM